jgi:multisubunit Na+/H+ antiporter MnhF subunit
MNLWLTAAVALLPALAAAGILAATAGVSERLIALEFATVVGLFMLMLLAVGYDQPSFIDLGLTLVLLSFPGTIAYAHFLERWL